MVKSYLDLHPELTQKEWIAIGGKEIYEEEIMMNITSKLA